MAQISGVGGQQPIVPQSNVENNVEQCQPMLPRSGWGEEMQELEQELMMAFETMLQDYNTQGGGMPFNPGGPMQPTDPVVQPMYGVTAGGGGGFPTDPIVQPMYGVTVGGSGGFPTDPIVQPMYGIAAGGGGGLPTGPVVQPMYGVTMA